MDAPDEAAFLAALAGHTLAVTAGGRDAAHRLAVYRNGIVASLADALAATYPVTAELIGEEMFRAAAVAFARTVRPASPVLHAYGGGFANHLATLPGLAPYPFVPEVARIEFARVAATHAADAAAFDPAALAAVANVDALAFVPHPATRLVATPHGGVAAWRRSVGAASVAAVAALVTRPAMAVHVTPLDAPAARLAAHLLAGRPLGAAADGGLAEALAPLFAAGAFAGIATRGPAATRDASCPPASPAPSPAPSPSASSARSPGSSSPASSSSGS